MPDGWLHVEWLQKEKAWPIEGMTLKSSLSKHSYLCRYINHTWLFFRYILYINIFRYFELNLKYTMYFIQHPVSQPIINPATLDIHVEEYVAPRFLRKMKSKVITKFDFVKQIKELLFDISTRIYTLNPSYFSAEAKDSRSTCKCKRS